MPRLSFAALQSLDLPLHEIVSGRNGFIHDLFLTFPYEVSDALPGGDQDLVVLIGKKDRGAKMRELIEYPGRVIVICAPGDAPIRGHFLSDRRAFPPNVVACFATNNLIEDRRAITLPLGVRVNKLRALQFVRQNMTQARDGLLYGNFTVNEEHYRPDKEGKPHIRARLVEKLADEPWVNMDLSDRQRDTPEELIRYYSQLAAHRFVLSPEGNGIDCYRTWEALYLGAIPIVMLSRSTSAFTDLPILFTGDYGELSEAYLEQHWLEMSRRSYEIDGMLKSFYFRRFLAAVSELDEPRFLCWRYESRKFLEALSRSSHSAAGIVTETPRPPFVRRGTLMDPNRWNVEGSLRLKRSDHALELATDRDGVGAIRIPLQTIAGGPFRLTGEVRRKRGHGSAGIVIALEAEGETIVTAEAGNDERTTLGLDFVARSDRTTLSIRASSLDGEQEWMIHDLSLEVALTFGPE